MSNPSTPSANNTAFGRGAILFDRFDANGVRLGQFLHLGNCDSLATSISTESVDMVDYTQATSAPYNSTTKSTTVGLKISGFEIDPRVLAIVMSGDLTSYTQVSSDITGETIAAASLTNLKGSFFRAAKRNISAAVMTQGVSTLVAGTDYEVFNSYTAMFRVLPGGSTVVDGTALVVSYTAAALSGASALDVVRGFNTATVKGQLLFIPNNATGPNWEVLMFSVTLTPEGDFSLIADDWIKWNVSGKVLSDATGDYGGSSLEPYMTLTKRS